jgi:hypothetical protein
MTKDLNKKKAELPPLKIKLGSVLPKMVLAPINKATTSKPSESDKK